MIKALEAHVETLKGQLTAAEARLAQHVADLTAEKARTEKAIEAFAALTDRLDALAAERANPWWSLPRRVCCGIRRPSPNSTNSRAAALAKHWAIPL